MPDAGAQARVRAEARSWLATAVGRAGEQEQSEGGVSAGQERWRQPVHVSHPSDGGSPTEALRGAGSSVELSPRCTSVVCPQLVVTTALCHLQPPLPPSPWQSFLDIPVFSFTKLSWSPPSPGVVVRVWLGAAARRQQLLLPRKVHAASSSLGYNML